jgi:hypothetical protein
MGVDSTISANVRERLLAVGSGRRVTVGQRQTDGRSRPDSRCDVRVYLAHINEMKGVFDHLARIHSDRPPDNAAASHNHP